MKLVTLEMLQYFKTKLEGLFVKKEFKTGSTTEYKVLSDNNLSDDLIEKINNAGSATAVNEAIAAAKTEAITESKAYTDEAKTAANSYTDTEVAEALADAKSYADQSETDAVATAKAYTDEQVEAAKTELNTAIATATDDMATKTWASEQIATATTDMATNESVDSKIAEAKAYADTAESDAVATAKTYTDEQVSAAQTILQTAIGTAKTEAVSESKTYADEQVATAKTELTATINERISTAYKIKGSTTFANLPALSETEEGHVYNLSDAFTSTADFVEGEGKKYPAGSNVVCIEVSEGVFKWDVLAGFIDTDTFVKNTDIETITEAEIDALFAA